MSTMTDFRQRMHVEERELNAKINGLKAFIGTGSYLVLHEVDQTLLRIQLNSMQTYHTTLSARIARLPRVI